MNDTCQSIATCCNTRKTRNWQHKTWPDTNCFRFWKLFCDHSLVITCSDFFHSFPKSFSYHSSWMFLVFYRYLFIKDLNVKVYLFILSRLVYLFIYLFTRQMGYLSIVFLTFIYFYWYMHSHFISFFWFIHSKIFSII